MATAVKKAPVKKAPTKQPPKPKPAVKAPQIDSVVLPAGEFARGWHNVGLARSKDHWSFPILCALRIEAFSQTCVRLIATDSYRMHWCVIGTKEEAETITLETEPVRSAHALDPTGFGDKLVASIEKASKQKKDALAAVTLHFTKDGGVEVHHDGVRLNLYPPDLTLNKGVGYPNWRKLAADDYGRSSDDLGFNPQFMATFSRFKRRDNTFGSTPLMLSPSAPLKPCRFTFKDTPQVDGLLMPVRVS